MGTGNFFDFFSKILAKTGKSKEGQIAIPCTYIVEKQTIDIGW